MPKATSAEVPKEVWAESMYAEYALAPPVMLLTKMLSRTSRPLAAVVSSEKAAEIAVESDCAPYMLTLLK